MPILLLRSILALLLFLPPAAAHAEPNLIQRMITALQGSHSVVTPPPASVEVAFSPNGGGTDLIVKAIQSAHKTIRMATYSFTSRPIAKALIAAHQAGVDVELVADHDQISKDRNSAVASLADAGIPIRIDTIHAIQHDKYIVIDSSSVETGSFNYTAAAEQHNSENVVVLWAAPALADAYQKDWQSLWDRASPYAIH